MKTAEVIQIVPRLPPPRGGRELRLALAGALRDRRGVAGRFAAVAASPAALGETLAGADLPVLLHYAGYGYQPRGCPTWLVGDLRDWKRREGGRLVTVFHEVYAGGPPWRSSFWLSPLQRRLAAELARLSDGMVTSLETTPAPDRIVPEKKAEVLPVFSTVGEPAAVPLLAERRRRLVVFGGPGARGRAYGLLAAQLTAACRTLGVEIRDVGPVVLAVPAAVLAKHRPGRSQVRRLGEMAAGELSGLLLGSLAGFSTYPAPFLGKSTVFPPTAPTASCRSAPPPRPAKTILPLLPLARRRGGGSPQAPSRRRPATPPGTPAMESSGMPRGSGTCFGHEAVDLHSHVPAPGRRAGDQHRQPGR